MNNKIIISFAITTVLVFGGLYINTWIPLQTKADVAVVDTIPDSPPAGDIYTSSSASFSTALASSNPPAHSSLPSRQEGIAGSAQSFDSATNPALPSSSDKLNHQENPVSQALSQRPLKQGKILSRGQPTLKTLEEKQRDWWLHYSRQVPQLLLKGTCSGLNANPDIQQLKQMADSGDKCAMGNYATALISLLGRQYVSDDAENMVALRSQVKPLLEYLGSSTGGHPLVAGVRSCASIIYFNDTEEAIAWEMVNKAYYSRDVYYLMGDCNAHLIPPDNEEAYQRALALALFYVDYYQLDK